MADQKQWVNFITGGPTNEVHNTRDFPVIPITNDMRISAKTHADERLKYDFNRFRLDDNRRLSMIASGTIGQIAFKSSLEQSDIPHEFQMQAGKYDNYDFEITNRIIEVKTSGHSGGGSWKNLNAIYNYSQLKNAIRKNYFCSVQIFVDGYGRSSKTFNVGSCKSGIIAGWIEISKIAQTERISLPFGPAQLIPLEKLNEIDALLKQ